MSIPFLAVCDPYSGGCVPQSSTLTTNFTNPVPTSLPTTGVDVWLIALIAVLLVLAGSYVVARTQR